MATSKRKKERATPATKDGTKSVSSASVSSASVSSASVSSAELLTEKATGDDQVELLDAEVDAPSMEDLVDEDEVLDIDDDGLVVASRRTLTPAASSGATELAKRDPLSAYVQETKRYPLLSREEEHELAVRLVEHGDSAAARKLVEANLRLVVKIAYEYQRAHQNLLDMVQEGNVGLMQAVSKYDPHRGVKLSSYAAWWIRAYILKFVLNNHRLVKIGTTQAQRKLFFNLKKEKAKLESMGFAAEAADIAKALDVREKDVVEMQKRLAAPDASFDAPLGAGEDEGMRTRYDIMEASGDRPDEAVEASEFQNLLKQKLALFAEGLDGREEVIFRDRWLTEEPVTLQEIGNRYSISRERARQLEKRMLGRLRTFLERELGAAVDIDAIARE